MSCTPTVASTISPRRLVATRYVQPLREGGSLPAVVDTDGGMFVVKFRGAGQGAKALVAELLAGMIGRVLGLPVPELAIVELSPAFGRAESDPEIQDILRKSHGANVGLQYLDGAFNFDEHAAAEFVSPELATRIVWFDALITNPDRTHQNPNLLIWQRKPWLIDHGAAFYAHHDWGNVDEGRARVAFPRIRDHVLLTRATDPGTVDEEMTVKLDPATLETLVESLPDDLLADPVYEPDFPSVEAVRERYLWYLRTRLTSPRGFVATATEARAAHPHRPRAPRTARR
jgi:hypothetical protein